MRMAVLVAVNLRWKLMPTLGQPSRVNERVRGTRGNESAAHVFDHVLFAGDLFMSRHTRSSRFHPDRAAGGHRHHRGPDRPAAARRPGGPRGGPPCPVRQQPEATGPGAATTTTAPSTQFPCQPLPPPVLRDQHLLLEQLELDRVPAALRWSSSRSTTRSTSATCGGRTRSATGARDWGCRTRRCADT